MKAACKLTQAGVKKKPAATGTRAKAVRAVAAASGQLSITKYLTKQGPEQGRRRAHGLSLHRLTLHPSELMRILRTGGPARLRQALHYRQPL